MQSNRLVTDHILYSPSELQHYIHNIMLWLGIPSSLKGNQYLSYMVENVYYHPECVQNVMSGLYQKTADRFNTKVSNVERNCCTAISRTVSTERYRDFCRRFGCFQYGSPSVSNLVAFLGDALRHGIICEEFLIMPCERR